MHKIFIDASRYDDPRALHDALQMLLGLPSHYGHNADALYDCLSGRREKGAVTVLSQGEGEVRSAMEKCLCVFEDLGWNIVKK